MQTPSGGSVLVCRDDRPLRLKKVACSNPLSRWAMFLATIGPLTSTPIDDGMVINSLTRSQEERLGEIVLTSCNVPSKDLDAESLSDLDDRSSLASVSLRDYLADGTEWTESDDEASEWAERQSTVMSGLISEIEAVSEEGENTAVKEKPPWIIVHRQRCRAMTPVRLTAELLRKKQRKPDERRQRTLLTALLPRQTEPSIDLPWNHGGFVRSASAALQMVLVRFDARQFRGIDLTEFLELSRTYIKDAIEHHFRLHRAKEKLQSIFAWEFKSLLEVAGLAGVGPYSIKVASNFKPKAWVARRRIAVTWAYVTKRLALLRDLMMLADDKAEDFLLFYGNMRFEDEITPLFFRCIDNELLRKRRDYFERDCRRFRELKRRIVRMEETYLSSRFKKMRSLLQSRGGDMMEVFPTMIQMNASAVGVHRHLQYAIEKYIMDMSATVDSPAAAADQARLPRLRTRVEEIYWTELTHSVERLFRKLVAKCDKLKESRDETIAEIARAYQRLEFPQVDRNLPAVRIIDQPPEHPAWETKTPYGLFTEQHIAYSNYTQWLFQMSYELARYLREDISDASWLDFEYHQAPEDSPSPVFTSPAPLQTSNHKNLAFLPSIAEEPLLTPEQPSSQSVDDAAPPPTTSTPCLVGDSKTYLPAVEGPPIPQLEGTVSSGGEIRSLQPHLSLPKALRAQSPAVDVAHVSKYSPPIEEKLCTSPSAVHRSESSRDEHDIFGSLSPVHISSTKHEATQKTTAENALVLATPPGSLSASLSATPIIADELILGDSFTDAAGAINAAILNAALNSSVPKTVSLADVASTHVFLDTPGETSDSPEPVCRVGISTPSPLCQRSEVDSLETRMEGRLSQSQRSYSSKPARRPENRIPAFAEASVSTSVELPSKTEQSAEGQHTNPPIQSIAIAHDHRVNLPPIQSTDLKPANPSTNRSETRPKHLHRDQVGPRGRSSLIPGPDLSDPLFSYLREFPRTDYVEE